MCVARGYTADDSEWITCMQEASSFKMPKQLRDLFVIILFNNSPTDPLSLWNQFSNEMAEDFKHRRERNNRIPTGAVTNEDISNTLHAIGDLIVVVSKGTMTLSDFNLPEPQYQHIEQAQPSTLIERARDYDQQELAEKAATWLDQMNEDQKHIANRITQSYDSNGHDIHYFIHAPAGTGKTFVFNYLLAHFRSIGKIVLAMASSGIASILLPGGQTAHSTFQIPINLQRESICTISHNSQLGELILAADVFIWDEAPSTDRYAFECVNRFLQRFTECSKPFGGKLMILGGDTRQNLPVIMKASPAQVTNRCINYSQLWKHFQIFKLTINERVRASRDPIKAAQYAEFLLQMGEGRLPIQNTVSSDAVAIPKEYLFEGATLQEFILWCYPSIHENGEDFSNKAIVTPKNTDVDSINGRCILKHPGQTYPLFSADSIDSDSYDASLYPIEFLNSLSVPGLPPHVLNLKIGAPIILLRTIDIHSGLCNGTRLIVENIQPHCITSKIITGPGKNNIALIPRINLTPSNTRLPFTFSRRQFPVKLAYAMTINKSQGQSLTKVGIYLPQCVFSHGQLYVAFSRAQDPENVKTFIIPIENKQGPMPSPLNNTYTSNVVYRNVLL